MAMKELFDRRGQQRSLASIIVVFLGFFGPVVAGQDADKAGASHGVTVPDEYAKICVGEGSLAVFGKLFDPNGQARSHAMVSVERNYGGEKPTYTATDGKYCIKYPPGPDITSLWFADNGATCVEDLSGNENHYINKVFDKNCASFDGHAQVLGPRESAATFDKVAEMYVPIQILFRNTLGQPVQVLAAWFEPSGSSETKLASGTSDHPRAAIVPVDARIVASIEPPLRNLSLFQFGPVAIFSLPLHSRSERVRSLIAETAIRADEIIPNDSAVVKVVFVPRSMFSSDAFKDANSILKAESSLGKLVIVANRLASNGQIKHSTTVGVGELSDLVKRSTSVHNEPISLVVPLN